LSGPSNILKVNFINLKQQNQSTEGKSLNAIITGRISDLEFKDYTLLSFIVAYTPDDGKGTSYFAFLRTGSGNADKCLDVIGNVNLSFDIFSKTIRRQVTLEEIDSGIDHQGQLDQASRVTLTFVMMHKKAVECVQSYLDNSGRGGNDVDCLSVLDDINSRIDRLISNAQPIPKLSEEAAKTLTEITTRK